jgi:hypothetical protein
VSAASRGAPSGSRAALAAIWLASLAVLAAVVLAAFRLGFGEDVGTLLTANGVRAGFAAGAGALLALAGALRQLGPGERPLRELDWLGATAGAAGGGFAAAQLATGAAALALFALGAALGGGLGWRAARWLDRAQRGANLGALVFLGAALGVAALAGTYARARRDAVAPLVAWLLGDLTRASPTGAAFPLAAAALGIAFGARALARGRGEEAAWLALGLGAGAAGPLVFVGSFVPRTDEEAAPIEPQGAQRSGRSIGEREAEQGGEGVVVGVVGRHGVVLVDERRLEAQLLDDRDQESRLAAQPIVVRPVGDRRQVVRARMPGGAEEGQLHVGLRTERDRGVALGVAAEVLLVDVGEAGIDLEQEMLAVDQLVARADLGDQSDRDVLDAVVLGVE